MKIYMVGICGTGMAALAGLLKEQGHEVTGSDSGCYPPMSILLDELGIEVLPGFDTRNIAEWGRCDLAVIGNVATRDNPEAAWILENGIRFLSFPDALREFCLKDREPLVVTGTHGKSTTSSLLVSVLSAAGLDPGFMVGGVVREYGVNFRLGSGRWFVIEGDEYDTAFFDKTPKFLHYAPSHAIITSIEFDHADIYADLEAIESQFARFVSILPQEGKLVVCDEWNSIKKVVGGREHTTYGFSSDAHWQIRELESLPDSIRFELHHRGQRFARISMPLAGRHNALNGAAVAALASSIGVDRDSIVRGLAAAQGVKRRQEVVGEAREVIVIDDFAHHPTAVQETLAALRHRYPGRRLVAAFEPRTNTSRRAVFQDRYPSAFASADAVMVREVPQPEKAPKGDRFSSPKLVADLRAQGKEAYCFPDTDSMLRFLGEYCRPRDVVVTMSNGDFDSLCHRLVRLLDAREQERV